MVGGGYCTDRETRRSFDFYRNETWSATEKTISIFAFISGIGPFKGFMFIGPFKGFISGIGPFRSFMFIISGNDRRRVLLCIIPC